MSDVYDEFLRELAEYKEKYAGKPREEMIQLWLMGLEREEIVAVGYQPHLLHPRVEKTPLPEPIRALIRHALIWAWKDEEMHAIFIRGALLKEGGLFLKAVTFVRQWSGAVGGWVSSVRQNVRWNEAPFSRALATMIAWGGLLTGKISRAVRKQLDYHSFRDFCAFNIEAERTAALAFHRLCEIAAQESNVSGYLSAFRRMAADEERHTQVFEAIVSSLTNDDELAPGKTAESLAKQIGEVGEVFLPRALRPNLSKQNPLGKGGKVVVAKGDSSSDKRALFRRALADGGLLDVLAEHARVAEKEVSALSVVIKPTFMMAYHKRDLSVITDPELLVTLCEVLRENGITDIAVIEAPNIYDKFYDRRSVHEVARYLGIEEGPFRLVDASDEQTPHSYVRGMGQYSISETWQRADVRISFGKMRSHPIEMAMLSVANVESLGGRNDEYLFAERQAHRDTALMTILNDFPPHFAIVDAYDLAADGLIGVMGCPRPKSPRRVYTGTDAIAVDIVAARHMGVVSPTSFPVLRAASYWFADPTEQITVAGEDTPIEGWRGPYATEISAMLSFLASPVYEYGSGRGALFVSDIDQAAFPPKEPEGLFLRAARRSLQTLLGLRLPR